MAFDHTFNLNWDSGGNSITKKLTRSDSGVDNRSVNVTDGTSDQQVDWEMTLSDATFFYMVADVDMTVKTNSSGTPQETLNLKAGEPILWWDTSLFVLGDIFAGDITAIYVSNNSGSDGTLDIRHLFTA